MAIAEDLWREPEVSSSAEPLVTTTLGNEKLEFLVDTGAGSLVLNTLQGKLYDDSITIVGATRTCEMLSFFKPIKFKQGKLWITHQFLYLPNSPKPLLGGNLLEKLNAEIKSREGDIQIKIPKTKYVEASILMWQELICQSEPIKKKLGMQ